MVNDIGSISLSRKFYLDSRMYKILSKIRDKCIRRKKKTEIKFYEWEIVDKKVITLKIEEILQLFLWSLT